MKSLFFLLFIMVFSYTFSQKIPLDSLKVAPFKYCIEYDAGGNRIRTYICDDFFAPQHRVQNAKIKSFASQNTTVNMSNGSIVYYPVPTKDFITLEISDNIINEINSITLFDNNGRELINSKIVSNKNQFDLSKFDNGFVFIKISYKDSEVMYKIVKIE